MGTRNLRGFTLIELMIVVVVLSIIMTIGVTSYRDSMLKGRRAEAKADMLELAQLLERFYTENNSFATFAQPFNQSPRTGTAHYSLAVAAAAQTYTITATPQGGQADDTTCGTLTLTQAGARTAGGVTTNNNICWDR